MRLVPIEETEQKEAPSSIQLDGFKLTPIQDEPEISAIEEIDENTVDVVGLAKTDLKRAAKIAFDRAQKGYGLGDAGSSIASGTVEMIPKVIPAAVDTIDSMVTGAAGIIGNTSTIAGAAASDAEDFARANPPQQMMNMSGFPVYVPPRQPEGSGKAMEDAETQRAMRENLAAVETAVGGSINMGRKAGRNISRLANVTTGGAIGKRDQDLTLEEWEDRLASDLAYQDIISETSAGQLQDEQAEESLTSTGQLEEEGAPVRPEVIEGMSNWVEPDNLIPLGAAGKFTGKLAGKVGGAGLEKVGKVAQIPGKGLDKIAGSRFLNQTQRGRTLRDFSGLTLGAGTVTGLATAPLLTAKIGGAVIGTKGVQKLGEIAEKGGKELAGKIAEDTTENFLKRGIKDTMKGAAAGGVATTPFLLGTETPEEAANVLGGGMGIGGVTSGATGLAKGVDVSTRSALFDSFFKDKKSADAPVDTTRYDYDVDPTLDELHAKVMSKKTPQEQTEMKKVRDLYEGVSEIYEVPATEFDKIAGAQGEGDVKAQGVSIQNYDGRPVIFIKEGAPSLWHEGGHPIYQQLPEAAKQQFREAALKINNPDEFASRYESALRGTPTQVKFSELTPDKQNAVVEEMAAETTQALMSKRNIDSLTKDPSTKRKLQAGIGKWLESVGFETATDRVNSILGVKPSFTSALVIEDALRATAANRAQSPSMQRPFVEPQNRPVTQRIAELEKVPRPTDKSTIAEVDAYEKAQSELARLRKYAQPEEVTPPTETATPVAPETAQAKADAVAALTKLGYSKTQAQQMVDATTATTVEDILSESLSRKGQGLAETRVNRPAEPTGLEVPVDEPLNTPLTDIPIEEKPQFGVTPETIAEIQAAAAERVRSTAGKRKKPETVEKEVARAQQEDVFRTHSNALEGAGIADGRVTWRYDEDTGKSAVKGRILLEDDPVHQTVLNKLDPKQRAEIPKINEAIQNAQLMNIVYNSAEVNAPEVTAESRRREQAVSTAGARAKGEGAVTVAEKAIIPLGYTVSKDGNITIQGFSPDKLIGNAQKEIGRRKAAKEEAPYSELGDQFVKDFQGYVRNHKNGWKGDGSAPLVATENIQVSVSPEYDPYVLTKEQGEFFNLLQGNEEAKSTKGGQPTERAQEILAFSDANLNVPTAEGEVNPTRGRMNEEGVEIGGAVGSRNIYEPVFETVRADLIQETRVADETTEAPYREGLNVDRRDLGTEGLPRRDFVAAGFMPETPEFKNWFGDSKVVDEKGNPLVVYHGTPNGDYTVFREGSYFTQDPNFAETYKNPDASSIAKTGKQEIVNPKVYEVYIKIEKPFDTRNKKERELFQKEFLNNRGNGTPLSEKGLPDWTDGIELQEWIEEKKLPYDGLILDEGALPQTDGTIQDRGLSYVPFKPTQIKSATGNRGTFDPNNPDIRFMPESEDGLNVPVPDDRIAQENGLIIDQVDPVTEGLPVGYSLQKQGAIWEVRDDNGKRVSANQVRGAAIENALETLQSQIKDQKPKFMVDPSDIMDMDDTGRLHEAAKQIGGLTYDGEMAGYLQFTDYDKNSDAYGASFYIKNGASFQDLLDKHNEKKVQFKEGRKGKTFMPPQLPPRLGTPVMRGMRDRTLDVPVEEEELELAIQ